MNTYDLHPQRADVGVYDGHQYGAKGLLTFVTEEDYTFEGREIPEGSVFDGEIIELHDGDAELGIFCVGWHDFGPVTVWIEVPAELCEEHDDIVDQIFKVRYEEEFSKDKPGCLPWKFIQLSIRDAQEELSEEKRWSHSTSSLQRHRRWLASLLQYQEEHYKDVE